MAETNPTAIVAPTAVNGTNHINETTSQSEQFTAVNPTTASAGKSSPELSSKASRVYHSSAYPVFEFPKQLPCPPFIDVDGIPNFRDLGGYLSANGTTVIRPKMFYRCANPTQMTPEGLDQLTTTLGVKAVYDLRSGPEVARTTAGAIAAADAATRAAILNESEDAPTISAAPPVLPSTSPLYQSIRHFTPVYATEDTGPEALARKLSWYNSPIEPSVLPYPYSEGFVNAYRHIATHGASAYTSIFRHIINRPQDPLLFHCTAGKDRTGVLAALMLRLAGVDDETICWEYALTEPGLGAWRLQFIARMSSGAGLHGVSAQQRQQEGQPPAETMTREDAARVCGSRAGNMRAWLTLVLDGEFGGVEKYLREKCAFCEEEIATLKRNLIVDLATAGEHAVVRPCAIEGWTADGGCVD